MHITLDPATGEHALVDADTFTSFSVVLPAGTPLPLQPSDVPADLGWSAPDGRHVFITQQAVRALAGKRDQTWQQGFVGMVGYAATSGWLSPDGTAIQAHCTTAENADTAD